MEWTSTYNHCHTLRRRREHPGDVTRPGFSRLLESGDARGDHWRTVRPNLGQARLGQLLSTPFKRWAYMHYEIHFFRLKDRAAAQYGPNDGPPLEVTAMV
jgi:hypothetical protein